MCCTNFNIPQSSAGILHQLWISNWLVGAVDQRRDWWSGWVRTAWRIMGRESGRVLSPIGVFSAQGILSKVFSHLHFLFELFSKGDVILSLPMHLTLMVYPTDREMDVRISDSNLPDTVIRLAAKLLRMVQNRTDFCAYARCLPPSFPNPTSIFQHISKNDIYRSEMSKIVK